MHLGAEEEVKRKREYVPDLERLKGEREKVAAMRVRERESKLSP